MSFQKELPRPALVVSRFKGDDGWIYKPVRSATARMNKIRAELSLSNDPIWREASMFDG